MQQHVGCARIGLVADGFRGRPEGHIRQPWSRGTLRALDLKRQPHNPQCMPRSHVYQSRPDRSGGQSDRRTAKRFDTAFDTWARVPDLTTNRVALWQAPHYSYSCAFAAELSLLIAIQWTAHPVVGEEGGGCGAQVRVQHHCGLRRLDRSPQQHWVRDCGAPEAPRAPQRWGGGGADSRAARRAQQRVRICALRAPAACHHMGWSSVQSKARTQCRERMEWYMQLFACLRARARTESKRMYMRPESALYEVIICNDRGCCAITQGVTLSSTLLFYACAAQRNQRAVRGARGAPGRQRR